VDGVATMTVTAQDPGRYGNYGAWRAVAAVPAMVASALLLLVAFGGTGEWDGVVLLGWLVAGLLLLTRAGERAAVRVACRFRRLSAAQRTVLAGVVADAERTCGLTPVELDWYVRRERRPNAYAAGGRSIAMTTGLVESFLAGRTSRDAVCAVLVHELGHHRAGRATRFTLATMWLAAPWRRAAGFTLGFCMGLVGRRQSLKLTAVLATGVLVTAVVQAMQRSDWVTAAVLAALPIFGFGAPLADAALSRASERAADRYTVAMGMGPALAGALRHVGGMTADGGGLHRAFNRHPPLEDRLVELAAAGTPPHN
jgi:STE24 endopeptidase